MRSEDQAGHLPAPARPPPVPVGEATGVPGLLVVAEQTGDLDQVTGAGIIELLFELNRARHSTLLLVTHDEQLAQHCNRLLKLEAGRLVAP